MSNPFEIPITLELGNCTLTTRFGRVLQNDALKWRLKLMPWIGSKIKFLFSRISNILRVRLRASTPPHQMFRNNRSCKHSVSFVQKTLINHLGTGAISLVGRVGEVAPPHIVLPVTVEPSKPRLCHDARYLNLWMSDNPFSLDTLNDVPLYVIQWTGEYNGPGWLVFRVQYFALWLESFPFYLSRDRPLETGFFAQLVFYVSFTLMIVTMVSFKSLWIKGNMVLWPQRMKAILELLNVRFFWLLIIW